MKIEIDADEMKTVLGFVASHLKNQEEASINRWREVVTLIQGVGLLDWIDSVFKKPNKSKLHTVHEDAS